MPILVLFESTHTGIDLKNNTDCFPPSYLARTLIQKQTSACIGKALGSNLGTKSQMTTIDIVWGKMLCESLNVLNKATMQG